MTLKQIDKEKPCRSKQDILIKNKKIETLNKVYRLTETKNLKKKLK
jgi:hypothetical protein